MAVTLIAQKDRRALNRLRTPKCPRCGSSEHVVAVLRSSRFVHFRCVDCGEVQTADNPMSAHEPWEAARSEMAAKRRSVRG